MNGLVRPGGPVKIEKTEILSPDVMRAQLGGAAKATVYAVREKGRYFFVAPEHLGGTQEMPAGSLTDCINWSVERLGKKIAKADKRRNTCT